MIADTTTEEIRYKICETCEHFEHHTKICKDCWCFMPAKVKIAIAECPKDKWSSINIK